MLPLKNMVISLTNLSILSPLSLLDRRRTIYGNHSGKENNKKKDIFYSNRNQVVSNFDQSQSRGWDQGYFMLL